VQEPFVGQAQAGEILVCAGTVQSEPAVLVCVVEIGVHPEPLHHNLDAREAMRVDAE
jgi:hypothetical protein